MKQNRAKNAYFATMSKKQSMHNINVRDKKVLELAFKEYYRPLCYYAFKFIGNLDIAKDIVQEIFIKIWDGNGVFINEKTFHTYLYNSVRNNSLSYLEKESNRKLINNRLSEEIKTETFQQIEKIDSELINDIYQAIEELPVKCKEVFKLSYIQNLKVDEVAEVMGISVNTVKTQRRIAKTMLKKRLKTYYLFIFIMFW